MFGDEPYKLQNQLCVRGAQTIHMYHGNSILQRMSKCIPQIAQTKIPFLLNDEPKRKQLCNKSALWPRISNEVSPPNPNLQYYPLYSTHHTRNLSPCRPYTLKYNQAQNLKQMGKNNITQIKSPYCLAHILDQHHLTWKQILPRSNTPYAPHHPFGSKYATLSSNINQPKLPWSLGIVHASQGPLSVSHCDHKYDCRIDSSL